MENTRINISIKEYEELKRKANFYDELTDIFDYTYKTNTTIINKEKLTELIKKNIKMYYNPLLSRNKELIVTIPIKKIEYI